MRRGSDSVRIGCSAKAVRLIYRSRLSYNNSLERKVQPKRAMGRYALFYAVYY